MDNKFNRKGKGLGAGRKAKVKVCIKAVKIKTSNEDFEYVTKNFLKKGD